MVHVNDQHPFDVTPDDERRPVDPGQTAHDEQEPRAPFVPTDTPSSAPGEDAAAPDADAALRARRKHHRIAALSVAAAVIFTAGAGGGAAASLALARSTTATSADAGQSQSQPQQGGTSNGFGGGFGPQGGFGGNGFGSQGGFGGAGSGSGSKASTGSTAATSSQAVGLVTIVSQLKYENGESAGTGIILTSNGRILTNNHVIDGATSIQVTVQSTGRTYTADVVGTNATRDIAVLQLQNASGLTPADLSSSPAAVGDAVTAVGNANGTGSLSAAAGTVSALNQTITTASEGATAGETLHGLIEINADVVSGDSGGAVENANGAVVGVTTAASSGSADVTGYAIPISTAVGIAKQIIAGDRTAEITIGLPAFLGVSISTESSRSTSTSGAVVGQVLPGTAAAGTGLSAGDTITKVGTTTITSGSDLSKVISRHAPGDHVTVTYTDTAGSSHTITVTLTEGPAN